MPKLSLRPEQPTPPVIRLPVVGGSALTAELTGETVQDGEVFVSADVRPRRGAIPDVFVVQGPMSIERGPYNLWVRIGNASFRTDLAQVLSVEDFMSEVRDYDAARRAANED